MNYWWCGDTQNLNRKQKNKKLAGTGMDTRFSWVVLTNFGTFFSFIVMKVDVIVSNLSGNLINFLIFLRFVNEETKAVLWLL